MPSSTDPGAEPVDGPRSGAPAEVELTGGGSTTVARRGDAVHRTAGPWTPTVHQLLQHLHASGVTFVPRPLGRDEQGREVLTHLPGTVPTYPMPPHVWTPAVLATAGRQLAEVHAATRTFRPTGPDGTAGDDEPGGTAVWQLPVREPAEVVCLNDVAPYNMVFDGDGALTGWIDVDTASPGPRAWDLAHLAYRLVPLTGAEDSGAGAPDLLRYRRRLDALCRAYGAAGDQVDIPPAELLPVLAERLLALAKDADARLAAGAQHLTGHGDLYRREVAWLDQHADQLTEPLLPRLVVVTGPIASGKTTTAAALAAAATARGRTAVVLDVDDVAGMVAAPGAAEAGLWLAAHHAHGALVAGWMRSAVDLVVAVGPVFSPAERAALLDPLPLGAAPHWVLLDAPVATTLARALADPSRGLSRQVDFHSERHRRFRELRGGVPAAQTFDTRGEDAGSIALAVLEALDLR